MRLVIDSPDLVEFRGRPGAKAPLLVGLLLLAWVALSVALGSAPWTAARGAALLILVAASLGLIRHGLPRPSLARIHPGTRRFNVGQGEAPIGEEARLRLGPAPARHATAPSRYGVWVERPGSSPVLLTAGEDPARLLGDLAALVRRLPLQVVAGWGLPARPGWAEPADAPPAAAAEPLDRRVPETPESRHRVATTLLVGAAAVGMTLGFELIARPQQSSALRPISLVLPVLSIVIVSFVGLLVRSEARRLEVGDAEVRAEHRVLGLSLRRQRVPRGKIRSAHAVAPGLGLPQHLLLETDDGPVALPGEPADILRAQGALSARTPSLPG